MSRSSARTLRLALAPGEVAFSRAGTLPAPPTLHTPETGLAALLPLIEQIVAEPASQTGRVEVVVSQHFVRHVVTLAPGKALSRAEEAALVASTFESIYGEAAAAWRIAVQSQPPQFGLVGAAIDGGFVAQLEHLLAHHRFTDVHIRPLASLAASRLPSGFSGWWALAEPGWLSLFEGTGRAWQRVTAQPVDAAWLATVPSLIAREVDAAHDPAVPVQVWIESVGAGPVAAPAADAAFDWHLVPLRTELPGTPALLEY